MIRTIKEKWVSQLAKELLCEIMDQMSGIHLSEVSDDTEQFKMQHRDAVYGETTGDFILLMSLVADRKLFERMAEGIIGDRPTDQVEVEEYTTEFFNIVCGRFISELYNMTGQSARFLPSTYKNTTDRADGYGMDAANMVKFISDSGESAVFSWALASQRV